MKTSNTLTGLTVILIGVVFLLMNFDLIDIDFYYLWPLFILITGLIFEISYFTNRKNPGLLVPGGILITISLLFFANIFTNWNLMGSLWPIFPLAVAIGLFQLYLFGGRDKGVLISSLIIGGFSIIALSFTLLTIDFGLLLPIALIVLGIMVIFKK